MNEVINFYQNNYDEDGRLVRHDLELLRSKEIISRYLTKDRMSIADIGGASGVYSFWLAGLGHDVHLLDLTPRHIQQAKSKAESTGVRLASYTCADARRLPFENGSFDLALEMGPLYHFQDRGDRLACLKESYRILKDGGPVVCAVISRYASMIDGFKHSLVKDAAFRTILENDIETGCHENPERAEWYFTTAYMHTPDEIKGELEDAGFADIKLIAVEGFANALNTDERIRDSELSPYLLEYLRKTESVPELLGVSGHILAVGFKRH